MLFRKAFLKGIEQGQVTLAFRRWQKPTVRPGGTLLTPVGQLRIGSVEVVRAEEIQESEARRAGYSSRRELMDELMRRPGGAIYRIEIEDVRPDPRHSLRESVATDSELEELKAKLKRLDARSPTGAWTRQVLQLIGARPGIRSRNLCPLLDQDQTQFKRNVRKLKSLGLTESLKIGYRLSPRGKALLKSRW